MVSDPRTENIFLYIEGIKNARRFMSALRAAARCKPVLLIKVGKHPAGEKAALSHTGALVGADDVFDAALRRAGVVRLANVGQMYAAASALFSHFRPRGNRLAIITNGGGPGVMAADHAADIDIPLAQLSTATITKLGELLPPNWSRSNPIDILGDADPERYGVALQACIDDDGVDGVLAILTPQAMTDPTQAARTVIEIARLSDKPLVTCWMGEEQVGEARKLFEGAGDPHLPHAGTGGRPVLARIELLPQPAVADADAALDFRAGAAAPRIGAPGDRNRADGRAQGPQRDGIEGGAGRLPHPDRANRGGPLRLRSHGAGRELGLPVVMKIDSPQIVHKADSGGVRLNLNSLAAVRDAWLEIMDEVKKNRPDAQINGIAIEPMIQKPNGRELVVGMVRDKIFGPVIVFGPGGTGVEAHNSDRAVALPPLNPCWSPTCWPRRAPRRASANSATCRRSTWQAIEPCCCASRPWSANCRGSAKWTSTR
jgi:acetyltransferase